jgi:DNA mismatch repair protein MLH3
MNIFNSEACRGAIKFGDKLDSSKCKLILNQLNDCRMPFFCAHGRPTTAPLTNLFQKTFKKKKNRINFKKLELIN